MKLQKNKFAKQSTHLLSSNLVLCCELNRLKLLEVQELTCILLWGWGGNAYTEDSEQADLGSI